MLTPLVGREEEIELLRRRWWQAKAGEGAVVLLTGEPGIGKSRVAEAAFESLAEEAPPTLRLFCSPHRQHSSLSPFILQLERAADFRPADSDDERLRKLQQLVDPGSQNSCAEVPLLANLLSISANDRYPSPKLTPQQHKEATLRALLGYIERLSSFRPLIVLVEDVHWADPTSIELIDIIVERAPQLRLLLIVTYRPEFSPPWIGRGHTSLLTLARLSLRQCEEMVCAVVNGKRLPKTIADQIIERTDGVPLFIEEFTKALVESDALIDAGDYYTIAAKPPARSIPLTLHASLLARLDHLGPAREIAQIGSALGRRFAHQLIGAVSAQPQSVLDDALARLESAGLIWRRGMPPNAEYTFKHALVQDAAYGTLVRDARRALHGRIAETLERRFSDIGLNRPELLAHHYSEAGWIEKAADFWGKAGQLSLAHSALHEAAVQLARALEQIEMLPSTIARRREQIQLQLALANALMHTKGYAAPETHVALDRVRLLAERIQGLGESLEDPLLLFSVLHGFWVANHVAFNADGIVTLAKQFLGLAKRQKETFPLVLGHRLMGTSLLYLGDIEGGRAHLDEALANYDPAEHRPLASRLGQDGGVAILSNRLLALWLLGYPDAAENDAEDALENAREIGQAGTYLYALTRIASFHLACGNYEAAAAQSRELTSIAAEIDGSYWKAAATMTEGCLHALTGKASIAVPMIITGMVASRTTGARLRAPWYWSCLARAHAELGDLVEAWRCIDEAMAATEMTKETWQESDLHRIAGDLVLLSPAPNSAKAEAHFRRALVVAKAQKAKIWELRAATRLAQLWRQQGAAQRADNLLRPICSWFTEGFSTAEFREAGLLLADSQTQP
jgi:predicted ATPase